jgi:hypothetical protein
MKASPSQSTAAQKVVVGHETEDMEFSALISWGDHVLPPSPVMIALPPLSTAIQKAVVGHETEDSQYSLMFWPGHEGLLAEASSLGKTLPQLSVTTQKSLDAHETEVRSLLASMFWPDHVLPPSLVVKISPALPTATQKLAVEQEMECRPPAFGSTGFEDSADHALPS